MKVKFKISGEQELTLNQLNVGQCAEMDDGEIFMVTDEGFVSLTSGLNYQKSEHADVGDDIVKKVLGSLEFSE